MHGHMNVKYKMTITPGLIDVKVLSATFILWGVIKEVRGLEI